MFKATFARTARQSIIIAAACIAATETTKAAQFNWIGGGGSLNTGWNENANWAGGIKPVSADSSVIVFGPGAGDNFQDISIPLTIHEIQFAPGSSDHVGGFPLDLRGDPDVQQLTGFIHTLTDQTSTVSNNLILSSYLYVIGNYGSGPVVLNGAI